MRHTEARLVRTYSIMTCDRSAMFAILNSFPVRVGATLAVVASLSIGGMWESPPVNAVPAQGDADSTAEPAESEVQAASRVAKSTGRAQQVVGKTTEWQTVDALPNGQFLLKADSEPVRVRERSGLWRPIDLRLVRSADWWKPRTGGNQVQIAAAARRKGSALVSVRLGTKTVTAMQKRATSRSAVRVPLRVTPTASDSRLTLLSSRKLAPARVQGRVATFRSVAQGVDMSIEPTAQSFSLALSLRGDSKHKRVVALPMRLRNLSLTTRSGDLVVKRGAKTVSRMSAPSMTDASGTPLAAKARFVIASHRKGVWQVRLVVPAQPRVATTGPLTVRTGAIIGVPVSTYVWSASPSTSFANQTVLKVGRYASPASTGRAYLNFNLSEIYGKAVEGSLMKLWQTAGTTCSQSAMNIYRVTKSWPANLTWNTMNSLGVAPGGTPAATVTQSRGYTGCAAGWLTGSGGNAGDIPLTSAARAIAANPSSYFGFALAASQETSTAGARTLSAPSGVAGPSVWVTYYEPPNTARSVSIDKLYGGYTSYNKPVLRATISAIDGGYLNASWKIYKRTGSTAGAVVWAVDDTWYYPSGDQAWFAVPTALPNGDYRLEVRGLRNGVKSANAAGIDFSIDAGCWDYVIMGARGSGQPYNDKWNSDDARDFKLHSSFGWFADVVGRTAYELEKAILQNEAGATVRMLPLDSTMYPADGGVIRFAGAWTGFGTDYMESANRGKEAARSAVDRIHEACGKAKFAFIGYSQGAHVMADVMQEKQALGNSILGGAFFGDPYFRGDTWAGVPGLGAPYDKSRSGGLGQRPEYSATLTPRVVSFCHGADFVCQGPPPITGSAHGTYAGHDDAAYRPEASFAAWVVHGK